MLRFAAPAILFALSILSVPLQAQPITDLFQQNVRTSEPISAVEQAKRFQLPTGWSIQLVASEPQIQKPLNMAFDADGRLWVTTSIEYPYAAAAGQGRDRISILADTNQDGSFDSVTTFADGLNIPMGLYPYKNGVIVYSIPQILYLEDSDHDGSADQRHVLFDGMGEPRDTHGMQNAFRRGYDGWLYACHGFSNTTQLTAKDGSAITLESGNTYRFRPDANRVEQFTWGQVNPFGSCFTADGDLITSDCHTKPLTMLIRGAYYPSFGKPDDGLGFAPSMMDHLHESTGLAGAAILADDRFPDSLRNRLLVGNVVTSRINQDRLEFNGATAVAAEMQDFLVCDDPWFRPVDIQLGPDGAVYVADFYNRIIGHYEVPLEHPGRDRTRGRIWRITYDGVTSLSPQLSSVSLPQLLDALGHPNLKVRMAAMDQITDRIGNDAMVPLQQLTTSSTNPAQLACAQWCLFRLGQQDVDSLVASLANSQPEPLRLHSLRTLAEIPAWTETVSIEVTRTLQHVTVRAQALAAEALGLHPSISHAKSLVERLISGQEFDPTLRHAIRIALRNQLRDASTANQIVQQTWSAKELSVLSDVAVAVPNSAAASVCLQALLSEAPMHDQDRQRLVAHVAQYLSGDELNAAVSALRKFSSDDIDFQLVLLERLVKSDQTHPEVSAWALDVIRRTLVDHFRKDNVWETDNPTLWGFENRNSTDGRVLSMFSSLAGGETSTGTIESPEFACPGEIRFWLCGHRNVPDKPASDRNYIALIDSQGTAIRQAFPPRSDTARQVTWDTSDLTGQMVSLRIVDGETASAYAWLAIGELDESLPALPTADFTKDNFRLVAAVTLADSLNDLDEPLQNDLQTLFRSLRIATPLRHRLAGILSRQFGNSPLANILLDIAADDSVVEQWRNTLQDSLSEPSSSEQIQQLASEFTKTLPARLQQRLAVSLSSSIDGQRLLLELVQQGNISAATLNDPTVRSQIQASSAREIREAAQQMIDQLPTTDDKLLAQVARWQKQASSATEQADINAGKQTFTKNCAICHQFLGEGALIGPQLDGVKNRGIERMTEDILLPNRNVDAAFRVTLVTLHDGRVLSGVFRRMEGDSAVYANQKGEEFQVLQSDIEEQQLLPQSLMPANFHEVLKRREFVDLIQYLQSSK